MIQVRGQKRHLFAAMLACAVGATLAVSDHALSTSGQSRAVTISARPPIAPSDHPITLVGTIPSIRPGEKVELQSKDCGQTFFRSLEPTRSQGGGIWTADFFPGINTTVRAVWKGRFSKPITVYQRAIIRFAPKASDRSVFVVSVVARAQFWRKRAVVERLSRGAWRPFRTVVLTEQEAPGEMVWTSGEVRARVPAGTQLRAVLPADQAKPCYAASASLVVRT